MKKLICLTIAVFLLSAGSAFAQSSVPAGVRPGSPFYWFDLLSERIQLAFTLDPQDKAGALSRIGLERLSEAQAADSDETVGKLISDYQKNRRRAEELAGDNVDGLSLLAASEADSLEQLREIVDSTSTTGSNKAANALASAVSRLTKLSIKLSKITAKSSKNAQAKAAKAISKTADRLNHIEEKLAKMVEKDSNNESKKTAEELAEHVREATGKHISVLEGVLENAPEQAKKGIQNAINRSSKEKNKDVTLDSVTGDDNEETEGIRKSSKKNKNKSRNSRTKGKHRQEPNEED